MRNRFAAVGLACFRLMLFSLALHIEARVPPRAERTIARSVFLEDSEGWTVEGSRPGEAVPHVSEVRSVEVAGEVSDQGSQLWYFTSPASFNGDRSSVYNGELAFRIYHSKKPAASNSHPMPSPKHRNPLDGADIILEATCGHSLFLSSVYSGPRGVPTQYTVVLNEDAGWIDSRTGTSPPQLDMLGVLANLRSIKIRGPFYTGPESIRISNVELLMSEDPKARGRNFFPCCSGDEQGELKVCKLVDSQITPANLTFRCKGTFTYRVQVNRIQPRFSRRSGGATVTVIGENFGLTGANSILRIGGKPAGSCRYPYDDFPVGNAPHSPQLIPFHCQNGVLDSTEDKLDCGGDDCAPCAQEILPEHCYNGVLDADLGETFVGITPNSLGIKYDCGGECNQAEHCCNEEWDADEYTINCGGTRCQPCSPVAPGVGTSVERRIIASGVCSLNGCFCFRFPRSVSTFNGTVACPIDGGHQGEEQSGSDCLNAIFLDANDGVTNNETYLGKRIYITGGQGSGQTGVIKNYFPDYKLAVVSNWQTTETLSTKATVLDEEGVKNFKVGRVKIVAGGSGYTAGAWRIAIPGNQGGNLTIEDAWGTFDVDDTGKITSVQVRNPGKYRALMADIPTMSTANWLVVSCPCSNNDGLAVLEAVVIIDSLLPPSNQSTYMILGEKGTREISYQKLVRLSDVDQHTTLICKTPEAPKRTEALEFDVQSMDETGTITSSCITELSRGFEFGAHDYVWSLHFAVRQAIGVNKLEIVSMTVDDETGDIYIASILEGSCTEDEVGCWGLIGSHLPNRGLYRRGDFAPLILYPSGLITTIITKVDRYGVPVWATQIDSQNIFSRIQATSLAIRANVKPKGIVVSGSYRTQTGFSIRFWHVDPETNLPTIVARSQSSLGGGACNTVACTGDVCSSSTPKGDTFACYNQNTGYQNFDACKLERCAYISGFWTRIETQADVFVAEIDENGQWTQVRTRISTDTLGVTINQDLHVVTPVGSPDFLAGDYIVEKSFYMAGTVTATGTKSPSQKLYLGQTALEFLPKYTDPEDLAQVFISIPASSNVTAWGFIVKYSEGGVMWARLLGPLGESGFLKTIRSDRYGVYAAGTYTVQGSDLQPLSHTTCEFGATETYSPSLRGSIITEFKNSLCFPGNTYARYTVESYAATMPAQWDDVSGHGRHGQVTRGLPVFVHDAPGFGAEVPLTYVQGGLNDGLRFPEDSIPEFFTICSVTRRREPANILVPSGGRVLESVTNANWAHGHVNLETSGEATYDSTMTNAGVLHPYEWLVMCGQNHPESAVFVANGLSVGSASGGIGNQQLSINDGLAGQTNGYSDWAVLEITIWNRYLTPLEIDGVVLHYRRMLKLGEGVYAAAAGRPASGVNNVFLAAFDPRGSIRWNREGTGGNSTISAMDVTDPSSISNRNHHDSAGTDFEGYVFLAGEVQSQVPTDFGTTAHPIHCPASKEHNSYLSEADPDDLKGWHNTSCSGLIVAKGTETDIFVIKYRSRDGEAQWLKRLGQTSSTEEVSGIAVDDLTLEAFIVGTHKNSFSFERYRDVFDLVAAGRGQATGCPMDVEDSEIKARLGTTLTDRHIGEANCSLIRTSRTTNTGVAFVVSIDASNAKHGFSSRPWSQCEETSEVGCNADGVNWMKALGSGTLEPSQLAETLGGGVAKSRAETSAPILAWGMFKGFIQATGTQGVKTPGVDDIGFFNCCLSLGLSDVLDQVQDIFESYVMSLGA